MHQAELGDLHILGGFAGLPADAPAEALLAAHALPGGLAAYLQHPLRLPAPAAPGALRPAPRLALCAWHLARRLPASGLATWLQRQQRPPAPDQPIAARPAACVPLSGVVRLLYSGPVYCLTCQLAWHLPSGRLEHGPAAAMPACRPPRLWPALGLRASCAHAAYHPDRPSVLSRG